MKERATRLGGTLQIESELGEGTRIELKFSAASEEQGSEARVSAG